MLLLGVFALLALLGACSPAEEASDTDTVGFECDRACLIAQMNQYIEALVQHDSSGLPLAGAFKFTENTVAMQVGEGLWKTITAGPNDFKIYVADPISGQVGLMGLIQNNNEPVILAARLKVENQEISEIEHLVTAAVGERSLPNLQAPRPALVQPLDPSEKVSREQMLEAGYSYYEALVQDSGKVAPFADECQRRENGMTTANNQEPLPEGTPKDPVAGFMAMSSRMTCSDQIDTNTMSYITSIDERRLFADEEMGLVFGYSMFTHKSDITEVIIKGVPGIESRPYNYDPFNWPSAHIYKIRSGKIYEIEAIGALADYGAKSGW